MDSQSLASVLSPSSHPTPGTCPSQALARIPSHPASWNSPELVSAQPLGSLPMGDLQSPPGAWPPAPWPLVLPAAGATSFLEFLIASGPGDWLLSSDPTWAAAWLDKRGISLGLQSIRHRRGHLGPTSRSGEPGGGVGGAEDLRPRPLQRAGR